MERTASRTAETTGETGPSWGTEAEWDLWDAVAIDEVDRQGDRVRVTYDSDGTLPSVAVVAVVSHVVGIDVLDLDLLSESIDGDALDTLCGAETSFFELTFRYSGCEVTVGTDGVIEVVQE